jgi:site-specific DNA-cytosine methylase
MRGNGSADVAAHIEVARCLDTTGGYASSLGGTVVLESAAWPAPVAPTLGTAWSGPIDLRQVVAPTLTAANNLSRSPQSSEVTAQVVAILHAEAYRAQYRDGTDTAQTRMTKPCEDTVAGTLRAEGENRPSRPSHIVGIVSPVAGTLDANCGNPPGVCITGNHTHALKAEGADASEDGTGRVEPFAFKPRYYTRNNKTGGAPSPTVTLTKDSKLGDSTPHVLTSDSAVIYSIGMDSCSTYARDLAQPITRRNGDPGSIVQVQWASGGGKVENPTAQALRAGPETNYQFLRSGMAVRRLTPRECERLQGFPDDWTAISYRGKPAADGNRYKALGNSMAVNVMRWIGERIAAVDTMLPAHTSSPYPPPPVVVVEDEQDF